MRTDPSRPAPANLQRYPGTLRARDLIDQLSPLDPDTFITCGPLGDAAVYGVEDHAGEAHLVLDQDRLAELLEEDDDDDEDDHFGWRPPSAKEKEQNPAPVGVTGVPGKFYKGNTHPAVELLTCCGDLVLIDAELALILPALWEKGIHTGWSCQGDGNGWAQISFVGAEEADKFVDLVGECGASPNRIAGDDRDLEDVQQWEWRFTAVRFPFVSRCGLVLSIPRAQLAQVEHWLLQPQPFQVPGP